MKIELNGQEISQAIAEYVDRLIGSKEGFSAVVEIGIDPGKAGPDDVGIVATVDIDDDTP